MMNEAKNFETFTDAYLALVTDVLKDGKWVPGIKDPTSIGSQFGKKVTRTKELLVYSFCVQNPLNRLPSIKNRDINKAYALANFLWMLNGDRKGNKIVRFNDKGRVFLTDKKEIPSAIGPHIFRLKHGTYLEFQRIEALLTEDPSTRRAVIQLFNQKDLHAKNKDVPCFNHIQFFVRDNMLHSHVVMRSQSAFMVLPYDFFLFSLLHEALSVRLKVAAGPLYYTSNSLHIYEDEIERAESITKDLQPLEYSKMKDFSNPTIKNLSKIFRDIAKKYPARLRPEILEKYEIDDYWKELIKKHFEMI